MDDPSSALVGALRAASMAGSVPHFLSGLLDPDELLALATRYAVAERLRAGASIDVTARDLDLDVDLIRQLAARTGSDSALDGA